MPFYMKYFWISISHELKAVESRQIAVLYFKCKLSHWGRFVPRIMWPDGIDLNIAFITLSKTFLADFYFNSLLEVN
jgi:hypothetical protein